MALNHSELRHAVIDSANFLVRTGAISMSHHGNFSVRVPDTDTILLTATSSFDNLKPENLALLDLDGKLLEGEINPTNAEIVHMHAIVYRIRPETGAVVHTHSTYATSFALASRPLGCSYEALVRQDMTDGIPLAKYGPRGSAESVSNIADALETTKSTKAVLLENHGVLAFGADPAAAIGPLRSRARPPVRSYREQSAVRGHRRDGRASGGVPPGAGARAGRGQ